MAQYDHIAQTYKNMQSPTKTHVSLPLSRRVIGDIEGKRVADLGCGSGMSTRMLADLKPSHLVGVDISAQQISLAKEEESQKPRGIIYVQADVKEWRPKRPFDAISATYLLNYSASLADLETMCHSIFLALAPGGRFSGVTLSDELKPMSMVEYGRRFFHPHGKTSFSNGDPVLCDVELSTTLFTFKCYYWTRETYEACMREAGFTKVEWADARVDAEGVRKYGNEYWEAYRKNRSPVGFICLKDQ